MATARLGLSNLDHSRSTQLHHEFGIGKSACRLLSHKHPDLTACLQKTILWWSQMNQNQVCIFKDYFIISDVDECLFQVHYTLGHQRLMSTLLSFQRWILCLMILKFGVKDVNLPLMSIWILHPQMLSQ